MSGVIFFEDRADQICARLGIGRESVRRIGLGLCYSDQGVDADLVHTTRGAGDDLAMHLVERHPGELGSPHRPDQPGQPAEPGQGGRVFGRQFLVLPPHHSIRTHVRRWVNTATPGAI